MDQDKKTMRHFYCRDVLWETFEAMANDFDCSIDYLINESMRLYARSKNYQVPGAANPSQILSATSPGSPLRPTIASSPGLRPVGGGPGGGPVTPPAPLPSAAPVLPPRPITPPAPPAMRNSTLPPAMVLRPGMPTPQAGSGPISNQLAAPSAASPPPSSWSPPLSPSAPPGAIDASAPPLYLVFQGQRMLVDKDQFVIGRGSKTADLAIKDGNISRKHAVVLRRNGVYYIKDLGSTNGIEYKGMRIDNKRIDEGDAFSICDYELRFTYQPG
jgi:hypothetical protein